MQVDWRSEGLRFSKASGRPYESDARENVQSSRNAVKDMSDLVLGPPINEP